MDSVEHFLIESERSLKLGGKLHVNVPHFKNPSAYRLTHRHLFCWSYWSAFPWERGFGVKSLSLTFDIYRGDRAFQPASKNK
jgi:hypothetical protein